jgi:hypothetical protein
MSRGHDMVQKKPLTLRLKRRRYPFSASPPPPPSGQAEWLIRYRRRGRR